VTVAAPSPNLDVLAKLFNGAGSLILSTHAASLGLTLQTTLASGTYYLMLDGAGTGNPVTGYSDYASLGQYTVSGSFPVPVQAPAAPGNFRITSAP
jgi:hypothetical protein